MLAANLLGRGLHKLGEMKRAGEAKKAQAQTEPKPLPAWHEILGREGSHVAAGHIELGLVASTTFLGVLVSLSLEVLQGQFYIAQTRNDRRMWWRLVWLYPLTIFTSALLTQVTEVCKSWVTLSWRRAVTYRIHGLYFERRAYYHVLNQQTGLGVPDADMRICNDVKDACGAYAGVMSGAVQTAISMVMRYSSIVASVTHMDRSWALVPPLFVCCVIPTALSFIDYGRLWPMYGEMQHANGAYSQALTRVQLHSERICMLQGENFEYDTLNWHLGRVVVGVRTLIGSTFRKDAIESFLFGGLYPSGFQALATFTSAGIIATEVSLKHGAAVAAGAIDTRTPREDVVQYFGGYIRNWWGVVAAAGTLSAFIQTWSSLVEGQASVQRVASLFASMKAVRENLPESREGAFQDQGPVISFEGVTVVTPVGQKLLEQLTFKVTHGDRLLICGHNGAGKSSIIRCLSALWMVPKGVITRPGGTQLDKAGDDDAIHGQIYYLPQKPCSVIGSLSDQLTYPVRVPGGLLDKELRCWLRCVDLEYLADRNTDSGGGLGKGEDGSEMDWEQLLSLGEQQALAIARLFYHHPTFAVLDECTSAVSSQLEQRLYEMATVLGITCITITHRPALQSIHNRMLRLTGHLDSDGRGWELTDIVHGEDLPAVAEHATSADEALRRTAAYFECQGIDLAGTPAKEDRVLPLQVGTTRPRSTLTPEQEVYRRWPSSLQRFLAVVRLGLLEPGRHVRLAGRLAAILVGMRLHCDLLWQIWAASMGGISAALTGNMDGIVSEVMSFLVTAPLIAMLDTLIKSQGLMLATELSERISHKLLRLAFSAGAFVGVMRPGSLAHVENPMSRLSEMPGHLEGVSKGLMELMFRCSHGLYTLRTLLRGVGPVALLSPPTYFAVFRLCLLIAPDFAFLNRREAELETRLQVWHTRLRHYAEPVAFSGGGVSERRAIEPHFDAVIDFKLGSLRKRFLYNLIESLFSNHSHIPLYMQRLMSSQFARRNVVYGPQGASPEVCVQQFMFERSIMYNETMTHRLGSFAPTWRSWDGMHCRLLELVVALESAGMLRTALASGPEGGGIEVEGLDLVTPGGSCLACGVGFTVREGAALVVSGPNACGKSLLGSVLLGLWPTYGSGPKDNPAVRMPGLVAGAIRPPLGLVMPAPQRIYLPPGSLGDQVCYPTRYKPTTPGDGTPGTSREAAMFGALSVAGIEYLHTRDAKGWLQECRWEDVLSGGEQQRMGFSRVLYQRPKFAILDECTSMVAHDAEEGLYRKLVHDFHITPITLSQRLFMPDIHDWELKLGTGDEGGWSLVRLRHGDGAPGDTEG